MTTRSSGRFTLMNVLEECEKSFSPVDDMGGIKRGKGICRSFDRLHPFLRGMTGIQGSAFLGRYCSYLRDRWVVG